MQDENNQNKQDIQGDTEPIVEAEEDNEFVPEDGEGNTATTKDTVKELREKLKKAVAEKQEYLDGWQRAKAEFINARKRDEEDKKEFAKFAKAGLVEDMLPVLESFEMAKANKEAWEAVDKNWRIGVEHIYTQLLKVLEDNGVKEINPIGEKFDPMRDEAVSFEPVADKKLDQTITKVIQKGYSIAGKEVKAPRVIVGEFKKE